MSLYSAIDGAGGCHWMYVVTSLNTDPLADPPINRDHAQGRQSRRRRESRKSKPRWRHGGVEDGNFGGPVATTRYQHHQCPIHTSDEPKRAPENDPRSIPTSHGAPLLGVQQPR